MMERTEEKYVEKKETAREVSRRLGGAQKKQLITESKLEQRLLGRPPRSQAKVHLTFKVPVKDTKHFEISRPIPPSLKIQFHNFIKPKLFSLEARHAVIITPTISTVPKVMALPDISVPTLTPIIMRKPATLSLGLMLKRPLDISVRQLVYPESVKGLGILNPVIKPVQVTFQRLSMITMPLIRSPTIHVPNIQLMAPIRQPGKEVESVVYKLRRMDFRDEDIVKWIREAYGAEMTDEDLQRIFKLGEEGKIKLIAWPHGLPEKILEIIDQDIRTSGGVLLRSGVKLAYPEISLNLQARKASESEISRLEEKIVEEKASVELSLEFSSLFESLCDERYFDEDYRRSGGLGSVGSEGLICILVDKSREFHELIELLCAKLWRIKSEGLPQMSIRGYDEEMRWRELSDVTELDGVQRIIEDLSTEDLTFKGKEAINKAGEEFVNQVKAKSIEGCMRFLLLPVNGKLFNKAYDVLTSPKFRVEHYLKHAKFLAYKLKSVDEEFLGRLLASAFGFAETPIHSPSIGEYALELHGKFCRELEKIIRMVQNEVQAPNWPKPNKEGECWLHWALKHLTYMHLINNENMNESNIESEVKIENVEKVADVSAPGIAIEIETMYGTGDPIGAKINPYTIRPYWEAKFSDQLWVVIPNLHALLYANSLLRLRKSYMENHRRKLNLEIYVADVTGTGAKLIYNKQRKPGLVKLVDVLNFVKSVAS